MAAEEKLIQSLGVDSLKMEKQTNKRSACCSRLQLALGQKEGILPSRTDLQGPPSRGKLLSKQVQASTRAHLAGWLSLLPELRSPASRTFQPDSHQIPPRLDTK
jgi:hypothetical protein